MTDQRAAARIRRHLLETADERPADGQLAAILAETAERPQRPRWTLPLLGLVDRSGARTLVPLRWAVLAALLLIAIAGFVLAGGGTPEQSTPFEGTWSSIDIADGSLMTVVIGEGQAPSVHFVDTFSVKCAVNGDDNTVFTSDGTGKDQGQRLLVHVGESGCTTWRVGPSDGWYDYNPDTDTLTDSSGDVWSSGLPATTPDPADFAAQFEGRWTAVDMSDLSQMQLVIGPGATPTVHFEDDMASACRNHGDSSVHYVADGTGEAHGWLLSVQVGEGGCDTWRVPPTEARYQFNALDDTIEDAAGVVWSRAEG